ncbi:methyltransferase, FxLD system [Sinosporangium siamense]|uniref:methyltransferase, FxLD system n=1 Tax=Sinosporangium siamense TaxID=1367973 RepID=UPI0035E81280
MNTDTAGKSTHSDPDAAALRAALVDRIADRHRQLDLVLPPEVEAVMRRVPRHLFTPGASLQQAYSLDSVVTKSDEHGVMLSTVSAPPTVAMMLGQLGELSGKRVLEIGSGGYNAALLRELVGPDGSVTSIDIDQDVVDRARACLAKAGYRDVRVLRMDGESAAPEFGPWDRIVVTVGAWEVPTAWVEQLTDDGRLVVPLRTFGLTRSWAFRRRGDALESLSHLLCGFVPIQGMGEHRGRGVPLHGEQVGLWLDEGQQVDEAALSGVLASPRAQVWSGVTVGRRQPFHDQDLWLAGNLRGFALLTAKQQAVEAGVVSPSWRLGTPAVADGGSLAYRAKLRSVDPEQTTYEFGAYGHGPDGAGVAERLAEQIRRWDQLNRPSPHMTVHPASTPDAELPHGYVLAKRHSKIVISWPDHDGMVNSP